MRCVDIVLLYESVRPHCVVDRCASARYVNAFDTDTASIIDNLIDA